MQRWFRWSLLAAAVLMTSGGTSVLLQTATEVDERIAGFGLLLLGAVAFGSFLRDRKTSGEDTDDES